MRRLQPVETKLHDDGPNLRISGFVKQIEIGEPVDLQESFECRPIFICKAVDGFQIDEFFILSFVKPEKLPCDKDGFGQQFRGISLPSEMTRPSAPGGSRQ